MPKSIVRGAQDVLGEYWHTPIGVYCALYHERLVITQNLYHTEHGCQTAIMLQVPLQEPVGQPREWLTVTRWAEVLEVGLEPRLDITYRVAGVEQGYNAEQAVALLREAEPLQIITTAGGFPLTRGVLPDETEILSDAGISWILRSGRAPALVLKKKTQF